MDELKESLSKIKSMKQEKEKYKTLVVLIDANVVSKKEIADLQQYDKCENYPATFNDLYVFYKHTQLEKYALISTQKGFDGLERCEGYQIDYSNHELITELVKNIEHDVVDNQAGIEKYLTFFGGFYIILGIIIGLAIFPNDPLIAIVISISCLVSGFIMVGFSKIITILLRIERNTSKKDN